MKSGFHLCILVTGLLFAACGGGETATRDAGSLQSTSDLQIQNCSVLNTAADEFAPVVVDGGARVFYTSNRSRQGRTSFLSPGFRYGEAVFVVERQIEEAALKLDVPLQWSEAMVYRPEVFDRVNTGTMAFDTQGEMYLSSGSYLADGSGGADLFRVTALEGAMSTPVAMEEINSPWWDAQPALSPDGRWLVFASDRKAAAPSVNDEGSRVPQLWASERQADGSWGAPVLLPSPVNSGNGEMSPHFSADGRLYFSTLRWPDAGFDIVRSARMESGDWSEPERLAAPINSDANDCFPFITADRLQMLLASDRPGGAGGYDIWYAEVPYCITVIADVELLEPERDGTVRTRPGPQVAMEILDVETGRTVAQGRSGLDGRFAPDACLRAGRAYILRPENASCYHAAAPVRFSTPVPDEDRVSMVLRVQLERPLLPEFQVWTDTIPFFVTGYWYPNTPQELARLRNRMDGNELPNANFIDLKDYDYEFAAQRVDRWFAHLFSEIENMIVPMLDTCYTGVDTLRISVLGHVDSRGLAWGRFDEGETVRTQSMTISPGTVMQKQEGNVKLSHLRAFFTMGMIDREMRARSERYALLRDQRRIQIIADGAYIAEDAGRDSNDPYQRKFIINVEVLHGHE